jgi:hypothetical protein
MNREILFRGKRVDNGEWVVGWLTRMVAGGAIVWAIQVLKEWDVSGDYIDGYQIDPETVGQFSGLIDKNGNRIFEGDVLINPQQQEGVVVWSSDRSRFELHGETKKGNEVYIDMSAGFCKNKQIIGNIHENEL